MEPIILIVDDALFMRRLMKNTLVKAGFNNIIEAANGKEALAMYKEYEPSLVLLDITMPGMTGMEVLDQLLESNAGAKIIMCSAVGQEVMITRAIRKGALDYIVKPFKEEQLITLVKSYI